MKETNGRTYSRTRLVDFFTQAVITNQLKNILRKYFSNLITLSTNVTSSVVRVFFRVPTRTGKPGKMGRHFPVREKSGNFEQTRKVREKSGKITQNTGKLGEFEMNII